MMLAFLGSRYSVTVIVVAPKKSSSVQLPSAQRSCRSFSINSVKIS